jgi:hypothetical protein
MKEGKDRMNKLLLTLSCVSAMVLASQAQAQSGASAAAEAAAAARAAGAATRTGVSAGRTAVEIGTGAAAVAGSARQGSTVADLLGSRSTESAVTAGTCTRTTLGNVDVRQAQGKGVVLAGSACSLNLSNEALSNAGLVAQDIAAELDAPVSARSQVSDLASSLHAGAERLERTLGISDAAAEERMEQVLNSCDIFAGRFKEGSVVAAMKSID